MMDLRILWLLIAGLFGAQPLVAQSLAGPVVQGQEYMTQEELVSILAVGGTTPEAMGMEQLSVCEVYGVAQGNYLDYTYGRVVVTKRLQHTRLLKQAETLNENYSRWVWTVNCTLEWQLMSDELRHWLKK